MDNLVYYRIDVGAKAIRIDARSANRLLSYCRPRHETVSVDRPQFGYRDPIARHDDGFTSLHLPKDGTGIITQFSLGDGFYRLGHKLFVADVAFCSKLFLVRELAESVYNSYFG